MSFAVMAIGVLGAAASVLVVTAVLVAVLPASVEVRAALAIVGIVVALFVMSRVSKALTRRAIREMEADDSGSGADGPTH